MTSDGEWHRGPLLASSKVSVREPESDFAGPSAEVRLRALCCKVMGACPASLDESLLERGLHSLSAASLAWLIEEELDVRIRLSDILDNPSIAKLLKLVEVGSREEPESTYPKRVNGLPHPKSIPLSFAQEQVWFLEKLHPQLNSYRFQALLHCSGALNVEVLERSLDRIVSRHAILRTAFVAQEGETPRQEVRSHVPFTLPREDLRFFPEQARQRELKRRIEEELQRPFHLSRPPLVRWRLYQLDEQKYCLLHTEHHFVHDGWSYGVFLGELYAAYAALVSGESLANEPEPMQFVDFALWQRETITSGVWDHQLDYWRKELAGCPPPPLLPSDRRLGRHRSFEGSQIRHPIPETLWRELGQACSREGVTRFAWIQAVFHLFIHLYTGADDFCTGTGFANRRDPRFHKMLGMAINTLPIRAHFERIATFRDLLRRTQERLRFALDNQELPFEIVVKDLNPGRDANSNPFFNAFVACYDTAYPAFADQSLEISSEDGIPSGQVKFDLVALLIPGRHPRKGRSATVPLLLWEFSSELFDFSTGERMLNHFLGLLESSIRQPDAPVGSLSMAQDEEMKQILAFGRGPESPPQCETPLHRIFESVVAAAPNAPAVLVGETSLTYRELNLRANNLAHHLAGRGFAEGSIAAVALPRGPEAVVCFLAILKAGGAYLPIDLRDPGDRIACLLRLAKAQIVLTQSSLAASLPSSVRKGEVCFVDEPLAADEGDLSIDVSASSPAYILFTSGSTGVPKGVIVPHRAVSRLVFGLPAVQLDSSEILLHLAPLSFDASTFEIWGALLHGAKLVISCEDLPDFRSLEETILRHGITTTWLTSSLFNQIIDISPEILRGLRQILTGGEALSPNHVRRALDLIPGARIINGYGPTEATTFATVYQVPRSFGEASTSVPIGRPLAGTQAYVLSDRRRLVSGEAHAESSEDEDHGSLHPLPQLAPIGVPGELYIGGEGVAIGYLNLPKLTTDRFLADPFAKLPGGRLYKTGDLVRWRPDGNLDFLGRIDGQVKIRGFRIEPGEIEAVLEQHPSVDRAVVRMWEPASGEKQLAAYYEAKHHSSLEPADLLKLLGSQLPRYMIPVALLRVEKLPLTAAGKVDWRALPKPATGRPQVTETYLPPRNAIEKQIAAIWSRLLNVKRVGVHDDFFELGGHSLIATRIISQIRREFDVEIPLRAVFESSTIEGLARQIARRQKTSIGFGQIEELLSELKALPEESDGRAVIEVRQRALQPLQKKGSTANGAVKNGFMQGGAEESPHDLRGLCGLAAPPLRAVSREGPLPLSFAQQRLWIIDQILPGSLAYNTQLLVRLEGSLSLAALSGAIEGLVRRHETLRTRFPVINGVPAQEILSFADPQLKVIDLSGMEDAAKRESEALQLAEAEGRQLFDLAKGPLVRWLLIRLDSSLHFFRIGLHHIISDGWSQELIYRELAEFYDAGAAGRSMAFKDLTVQYADFACWQRQWLSGPVLQKHLDYWKPQLAEISRLDLPADRPHAGTPSFHGASERIFVGRDTLARIKRLASDEGATLFMALLAAFQAVLQRYTGQDDIAVGSPIANRNRIEIEGIVGFFVNSLVLRTDLSGDPTFREALRRVRKLTLEAYEFQDMPFEKLVEDLMPERTFGQNPFFQIMFALQNLPPRKPLDVEGLRMSMIVSRPATTRFEIEVHLWEALDDLEGLLVYNPDRFDASRIARMVEHYGRILQAVCSEPDRKLSDLPMLSSGERERQLFEWNQTTTPYPRDRCIHEVFEEHARQRPMAAAVVCEGKTVGYGELNKNANQLASYLRALGVRAGARVGICMERSAEMITGILGILKSGATYVPLDPSYPKDRLNFMIRDAEAPLVLCVEAFAEALAGSGSELVCVERDWPLIERHSDKNAAGTTTAGDLAYIIYTSGTTGAPKGVAVPHRAVMRLLINTNYVELGAQDRIAHISNVCFDAATFEIWGALMKGGSVVVIPKAVALDPGEFSLELKKQKVSTLFLTTALFNELAREDGKIFEGLKQVLFGGEAVNAQWVRHVLSAGPPERLVHVYGPTECTTFATYYEVRELPKEATTIPIGRPISNTTAYILDRHRNPVPVGVPGELYLGGDGLADGYLNQKELTLERFVPGPFGDGHGSRLYRTGDIVKYLPDGNIEFITRFDGQVKIRGFRIELKEIEAVLQRHPGVAQAVATVCEEPPGEKRLTAYYEPKGSDSPESADLLKYLSGHLPSYMMPDALIRVAKLPIAPAGKIDWRALSKLNTDKQERTDPYVAPRNAIEEQLAAIWSRLLNVERVGIHDNFFELGGHSLKVLRLLDGVKERTGLCLTVIDMFENPTVAGMAARRQIPAQPGTSPLIIGDFLWCLRAEGSRKPLFIIPGGAAAEYEMLAISSMLPFLEKDTPVYGVLSRAMDEAWPLPRDLRGQAAAVLKAIQQVEPHGPYVILGLCIASTLAVEIARQAERTGEPPGNVILFDAVAPPRSQRFTACLRGLGFDRLGWRHNTITTPTGDPVPSRIAEYYELLVNWTPAPFHSSLHLLFSSSTKNPHEALKKWRRLAKGTMCDRYLRANHQSFIREHVAETVAVLNEILLATYQT